MIDQTLTIDSSKPTASWKDTLCENLVLKALRHMKKGCLQLTLPNGRSETIGQPGEGVQATMRIHHSRFFQRCVLYGDVGFAESYIEGEWDTDSIERVIAWAIHNVEPPPGHPRKKRPADFPNLLTSLNRLRHSLRPNSLRMSPQNISEHYDLGNDFYSLWLDNTMTYSSAVFTRAGESLAEAQTAKYERLCQQLQLKADDHLLEIGCGWGGFSHHAAERYGCRITAITISKEQAKFARERIREAGLEDRVSIELIDYRKVEGQFDKIVSIEMMEALGDEFLDTYFAQIHRLLKPHGLVALQYITAPDCRHEKLRQGVDFIQKHIFPGSLLLSIERVNSALARTSDLFLHDLKDIGASYAETLRLWHVTFSEREQDVRALGFTTAFLRKWNFYLQYCEAAFGTRNISVVQATYTRPNNPLLRREY